MPERWVLRCLPVLHQEGGDFIFKRKVYDQILEWKKEWDGRYACLLEGARRGAKQQSQRNLRVMNAVFLYREIDTTQGNE